MWGIYYKRCDMRRSGRSNGDGRGASGGQAADSAGGGDDSPQPTFTQVVTAKYSPSPSPSPPPKRQQQLGATDDPEIEELNSMREAKQKEWAAEVKKTGNPWGDIPTLQRIFYTRMMPREPQPSDTPTLVILVGPPAAGKSSALVHLGLNDHNTVKVNPDEIFEALAHKYGYFPPEIKEKPKQGKAEGIDSYKERCDNLTTQNQRRLTWWREHKGTFDERYGSEFENGRDRDFEAAAFCTSKTAGVLGQYNVILPNMKDMIKAGASMSTGRLNVLLDTTGGMKNPFLEDFAIELEERMGYKIVVALVVSTKENCMARVSGAGGRNAQQHRKIESGLVGRIWDDFIKDNTPCKWVEFSTTHNIELTVVENTWTPVNPSGIARVVYKKGPSGVIELLGGGDTEGILGIYKLGIDRSSNSLICSAVGKGSVGSRGGSRKRRITRRRKYGFRNRKTIKKYGRNRCTRRRK